MNDKLKQRVEDSRQEWDQFDTDLEGLWENIESQLDKREKKIGVFSSKSWMKIAASLTLLLTVGWLAASYINTNSKGPVRYALSDISPELAETEYYYANQISEKLAMIQTSNAGVDLFVLENLDLLDSAYIELQQDLKDNADNEEVINAMIQNYRIKLQILEKTLSKIRQKEQKEDPNEIII
jgi:hypothetical protein